MKFVESIKYGTEVLVPRHFKPRGTERIYDAGIVIGLMSHVADVRLSDGRVVHCPVGLLSPRTH